MEGIAAAMMSDPEIMALMTKPGVREKLMQLVQHQGNPAAMAQLVGGDPDLQRIVAKLQGMQGGGGGGGAGAGAAQGAAPAAGQQDQTVHVRDKAHFDALVAASANSLLVVDFFTTWCGPCKRIAPAYAQLARSYAGRVVFAKVDGDQVRDVVSASGVTGFPTFHFYRGGSRVAEFSGANEAELRRLVELHSAQREPPCPYRHFPLRDETVTYRDCKFDAVRRLVVAHCEALAGRQGAEAPLSAEELKECDSLASTLDDAMRYHQSGVSAAQVAVVRRLLAWPADMAAPGLHFVRMLAMHPDGARALAAVVRDGDGEILRQLASLALSAPKPAYSMLALRALVNFFGRRSLARAVGERAEMLFNELAALSGAENAKVRLEYVVLALNFTILVRDIPALAEHKVQLLSTVVEMLGQANDDRVLYRLLVILGSIVYRDAETAELAQGFELPDAVRTSASLSQDAKVAECADEVCRAIASPEA